MTFVVYLSGDEKQQHSFANMMQGASAARQQQEMRLLQTLL